MTTTILQTDEDKPWIYFSSIHITAEEQITKSLFK